MSEIGNMKVSDIPEDYLEHHGIKGQKWGIRRFQNDDGSLTDEGKHRYGRGDGVPESKAWKEKDADTLSDDELKRRIKRLQQEKQYKELTVSPLKKEAISIAKQIFVTTAVTVAATAISKKYSDIGKAGADWLRDKKNRKVLSYMAKETGEALAGWVM